VFKCWGARSAHLSFRPSDLFGVVVFPQPDGGPRTVASDIITDKRPWNMPTRGTACGTYGLPSGQDIGQRPGTQAGDPSDWDTMLYRIYHFAL